VLNSTLLPKHQWRELKLSVVSRYHRNSTSPRTSGLHSGTQPRLCRCIIVHCPFHCETVHHRLFYGQALSLVTFETIVFSDACHSSEAVSACLPMSLPLITAGQLMYLRFRLWTDLHRRFSKSKKGIKKSPHFFREKSEGSMRYFFKFLKFFLVLRVFVPSGDSHLIGVFPSLQPVRTPFSLKKQFVDQQPLLFGQHF